MWLWKVVTKRKRRIGFAFLFIILLPCLIFYIAAVANDWYTIPILGIPVPFNSPPPPTNFTIPMMIPPTITNATIPWPDLYLGISVQANGTIAEGVEVTISTATAWMSNNYYFKNLDAVQVFFQESIAWRYKNSFTPLDVQGYIGYPAAVIFQRDETNLSSGYLVPYVKQSQIFFPAAGDYSPTVVVVFGTGTPVEYTYDAVKIHVASTSDLANAKATRVNIALTYALVAVAVIESISITNDITEDRTKDNRKDQIRPKVFISNNPVHIQHRKTHH